jgi:hypothetical protein
MKFDIAQNWPDVKDNRMVEKEAPLSDEVDEK